MAVTATVPMAGFESAELLALPPASVTALPKFTPLVLNCTVPVGVPVPGATALTVAVKLTDWPNTEGLTEEATVVVVLAGMAPAYVSFALSFPRNTLAGWPRWVRVLGLLAVLAWLSFFAASVDLVPFQNDTVPGRAILSWGAVTILSLVAAMAIFWHTYRRSSWSCTFAAGLCLWSEFAGEPDILQHDSTLQQNTNRQPCSSRCLRSIQLLANRS